MPGAFGYLLRKQFFPRIFKEIGNSSVVGAGSVITGPIPEYSFARGARQLKIQDRRNP